MFIQPVTWLTSAVPVLELAVVSTARFRRIPLLLAWRHHISLAAAAAMEEALRLPLQFRLTEALSPPFIIIRQQLLQQPPPETAVNRS